MQYKRINDTYIKAMVFVLMGNVFLSACSAAEQGAGQVKDPRGKMKPWTAGAWETGKYCNLFLEAGYPQAEIDAKLAKAYHDLLERET